MINTEQQLYKIKPTRGTKIKKLQLIPEEQCRNVSQDGVSNTLRMILFKKQKNNSFAILTHLKKTKDTVTAYANVHQFNVHLFETNQKSVQ